MKILHLLLASCFLLSFILCQETSICNEKISSFSELKTSQVTQFSSHDHSTESPTDIPHHDSHCLHTKIISQEKAQVDFLEKNSLEQDLYSFSYKAPPITNIKRPPSFQA